jgi:ATP-dependent Lhr-like helicase
MTQLPAPFAGLYRKRGWTPHLHQLAMLDPPHNGEHTLLIASTGGGKTLAEFLPSMIELVAVPADEQLQSLHTL